MIAPFYCFAFCFLVFVESKTIAFVGTRGVTDERASNFSSVVQFVQVEQDGAVRSVVKRDIDKTTAVHGWQTPEDGLFHVLTLQRPAGVGGGPATIHSFNGTTGTLAPFPPLVTDVFAKYQCQPMFGGSFDRFTNEYSILALTTATAADGSSFRHRVSACEGGPNFVETLPLFPATIIKFSYVPGRGWQTGTKAMVPTTKINAFLNRVFAAPGLFPAGFDGSFARLDAAGVKKFHVQGLPGLPYALDLGPTSTAAVSSSSSSPLSTYLAVAPVKAFQMALYEFSSDAGGSSSSAKELVRYPADLTEHSVLAGAGSFNAKTSCFVVPMAPENQCAPNVASVVAVIACKAGAGAGAAWTIETPVPIEISGFDDKYSNLVQGIAVY